ncbi:MAG: efflux transporter outer membrane subunit [Burkholderiaceae bacterium]|nr:efflux transporter outer membrane subunit [Burkholderiaceae bacterium]
MHAKQSSSLLPAALLAPLLLAACATGPSYTTPKTETPEAFKEAQNWKQAQPADTRLPTKWWEIYHDSLLNELEEQVDTGNQTVAQAEAQYREARAVVRGAEASYFPTVTANASHTRAGGPSSRSSSASGASAGPSTTNLLTVDASWEPDLWGRVRRTVEANQSSAQASAADWQAARLSAHAQLAQDYFQLRQLDADRQLYDKTVEDYKKSLELTRNQYKAGTVAKENVVLAEMQLRTTEAQAIDFDVQRAQMEHAIALLVGKPASVFAIKPNPTFDTTVPAIPVGVPSTLLERRPDIANAERLAASANAKIGVADAAWFPNLTLSAQGGYQSSSFAHWISVPNRLWSLGPSVAQTLFDGGALRAASDQARASYDASVANYRQTVLTGFQEVEDYIAALRILDQEMEKQREAVELSRRSVELTRNQYKAGVVAYVDVITVETTALSNERALVDLLNRRLSASVLLVKALGGGWDASQLPDNEAVSKR